MQLFFCSKEWQQWQGKLQPLEDETGYKEAKMKAVGSTSWNWTDKRNILSHANLFRYFKIFNKCIDFGCMFIVVHKSWGPAPKYWLLTNKKKGWGPKLLLDGGPRWIRPSWLCLTMVVTSKGWWLLHAMKLLISLLSGQSKTSVLV